MTDQGKTGTRFMVFDQGGKVVANAFERHEQRYARPGWVEHGPIEIWENVTTVVGRGFEEWGLDTTWLTAIGITNQWRREE